MRTRVMCSDGVAIPLTRGYVAWVDAEDAEDLARFKWGAAVRTNTVYAKRGVGTTDGRRTNVYMHRQILGVDPGVEVDHIDGNGLNNRRSNLRPATDMQQQANRASSWGTSRFRGVHLHTLTGKWRAMIRVDGRSAHLGMFASEEDAARAYDRAAVAAFGAYARLNLPEVVP